MRVSTNELRARVASAVALCALFAAPRARADGDDRGASASAAAALFQQGRADAAAGDWEHACARFAESHRLSPSVGAMLNLGDCEEHRGRLADALADYERAIDAMPRGDDRVPFARERVARLQPRVPRARIHPTGVVVATLDGVTLGPAAFDVDLPVNPGRHALAVRAEGTAERVYPFDAIEGGVVSLEAAPGAPLPARPPPPRAPARDAGHAGLAWGFVGLGGAALATGAVTGVLALDAASRVRARCPNHTCTSAADVDVANAGRTESVVSTVAFAVGAAALGAAAYVFVVRGSKPAATIALSPAGVVASGAF